MGKRTLGILEADRVDGPLKDSYGDYPAMFEALLGDADDVTYRVYRAHAGELPPSIDECDAYLITGSRFSVYDDEPWIRALGDFVVRLDSARKKLVGICFGHQLIAHVLGGRTEPAPEGWCVGVRRSEILFPLDWMEPYQSSVALPASHRDQVAVLPDRARIFASAERCPIAGYVMDHHILAIQAHPEFGKPYSRALLERRRPLVGEERYEEAVASYDTDTDQGVVAEWINRFIADDARG